jgi:hypothetical protein
MSTIRDLLDRFRPAGTAGPAGAVGVPADRVTERSAELAPVFASLAEAQVAAARIRSDAAERAQSRRAAAAAAAELVVAEARQRVKAVRAEAAAAAHGAAHAAAEEVLDRARAEAARLRDRATQRLPRYVGLVVDVALREAGVNGGPARIEENSDA